MEREWNYGFECVDGTGREAAKGRATLEVVVVVVVVVQQRAERLDEQQQNVF